MQTKAYMNGEIGNYNEMSIKASKIIESQIRKNPKSVLGLATGSTPIGMYNELSRMYREDGLDFSEITSVNLDEYYPIAPENINSYKYFMDDNLFNHVNINKANTHLPKGSAEDADAECHAYDELIKSTGGISIQVLGIGENGHIGFNEPADELVSGTHMVELTESTINANARNFDSADDVPRHALTMGMASIMSAEKIILLISGKKKHFALKKLLDDKINTNVPATLLKLHKDVLVLYDKEAYEG